MLDDAPVISAIVEKRKALSPERALLVGISGIDAAGKFPHTYARPESRAYRSTRVNAGRNRSRLKQLCEPGGQQVGTGP